MKKQEIKKIKEMYQRKAFRIIKKDITNKVPKEYNIILDLIEHIEMEKK